MRSKYFIPNENNLGGKDLITQSMIKHKLAVINSKPNIKMIKSIEQEILNILQNKIMKNKQSDNWEYNSNIKFKNLLLNKNDINPLPTYNYSVLNYGDNVKFYDVNLNGDSKNIKTNKHLAYNHFLNLNSLYKKLGDLNKPKKNEKPVYLFKNKKFKNSNNIIIGKASKNNLNKNKKKRKKIIKTKSKKEKGDLNLIKEIYKSEEITDEMLNSYKFSNDTPIYNNDDEEFIQKITEVIIKYEIFQEKELDKLFKSIQKNNKNLSYSKLQDLFQQSQNYLNNDLINN